MSLLFFYYCLLRDTLRVPHRIATTITQAARGVPSIPVQYPKPNVFPTPFLDNGKHSVTLCDVNQ